MRGRCCAWAGPAAALINAALPGFPHDVFDAGVAALYDRLQPHALAAAEHAEERGVALAAVARLFNEIGCYRWMRADFTTARKAYQRSVSANPPATDVLLDVTVPFSGGGSPAYLEIDKLPGGRSRATLGTLFEFQELCRSGDLEGLLRHARAVQMSASFDEMVSAIRAMRALGDSGH